MDSWFFLSLSPPGWFSGFAGPEEAKNLARKRGLHLIQIRLPDAEFDENPGYSSIQKHAYIKYGTANIKHFLADGRVRVSLGSHLYHSGVRHDAGSCRRR